MSQSTTITDPFEIDQFLKLFKKDEEKILLWQPKDNENNVHYGHVKKIDPIKQNFEIRPVDDEVFNFTKQSDIFFYSEKHQVASKLEVKIFDNQSLTFQYPTTLRVIKDNIFSTMKILEIENEKAFQHLAGYICFRHGIFL